VLSLLSLLLQLLLETLPLVLSLLSLLLQLLLETLDCLFQFLFLFLIGGHIQFIFFIIELSLQSQYPRRDTIYNTKTQGK
jgi:hypothetical protein